MAYTAAQELSSISFDKIIGGALDAVVQAQSNASLTTVSFIKNTGFLKNERGEVVEPIYVSFKYPRQIAAFVPKQEDFYVLSVESAGSGYKREAIVGAKVGDVSVTADFNVSSAGAILSAELRDAPAGLTDGAALQILVDSEEGVTPATVKVVKKTGAPASPAVYQDMELKVPILTMLPIPFIRIADTNIEFNVKINSMTASQSSEESKKDMGGSASLGYKGFGITANATFNASMSSQKKSSSTAEEKKEYSLNIKVHAVQDDMPAGISRILDILEGCILPETSGKVA